MTVTVRRPSRPEAPCGPPRWPRRSAWNRPGGPCVPRHPGNKLPLTAGRRCGSVARRGSDSGGWHEAVCGYSCRCGDAGRGPGRRCARFSRRRSTSGGTWPRALRRRPVPPVGRRGAQAGGGGHLGAHVVGVSVTDGSTFPYVMVEGPFTVQASPKTSIKTFLVSVKVTDGVGNVYDPGASEPCDPGGASPLSARAGLAGLQDEGLQMGRHRCGQRAVHRRLPVLSPGRRPTRPESTLATTSTSPWEPEP